MSLPVTWGTYKIVELDSGDALIHASNDLHGDGSSVDMLRVEAIT